MSNISRFVRSERGVLCVVKSRLGVMEGVECIIVMARRDISISSIHSSEHVVAIHSQNTSDIENMCEPRGSRGHVMHKMRFNVSPPATCPPPSIEQG